MTRDRVISLYWSFGLGVFSSLLASRIDRTPATIAIPGIIVFGICAVLFSLNLPRLVGSALGRQAIIVSALVYDGNDILLVEDDPRNPHWLVPPSAHVGFLTELNGGPHQAVIRTIQKEADIDIEVEGGGPRGIFEKIPVPVFAQSERQWPGEGHSVHHDLYYKAKLSGQRSKEKEKGGYQWVDVNKLDQLKKLPVPAEIIKVINDFKSQKRDPAEAGITQGAH